MNSLLSVLTDFIIIIITINYNYLMPINYNHQKP